MGTCAPSKSPPTYPQVMDLGVEGDLAPANHWSSPRGQNEVVTDSYTCYKYSLSTCDVRVPIQVPIWTSPTGPCTPPLAKRGPYA